MSGPTPFSTAIRRALPFGLLYGVHLPSVDRPMKDAWTETLHPDERSYAQDLKAHKKISWVGGRLAIRTAMKPLHSSQDAVLSGPYGAPILPRGLTGSISHKKSLAVAMVARSHHGTIGIDLEELTPERPGIAERVLTESELDAVRSLPIDRQWTSILLRFAMKEAFYKALFPHVTRYVGFDEAVVEPGLNGDAIIRPHLKDEEGPFEIEARYYWLSEHVLCAVRLRPAPKAPEN
ncbi:MAG: 4'-phosphopantetheinyl transferase superfamily protein [Myxococcota bacterium]|nr:4'-phosphopantetheinyl transferase superfamily protein [Myxococcota bacterium]